MGRRRSAVLGIAIVVWLAGMGSALAGDPIRSLERASTRLAKTRFAEKELSALQARGFTLSVRRGVIIASKTFSQRGFFPGGQSKTLSAADRAELARMIEKHAPGVSSRELLRNLGQSIRAERALEKRLDPVIDGLLRTKPSASGREVWRGARGSLVLKDGLLVGFRGFSQEGFTVGQGKNGLAISPADRDRLRGFLRAAE